MIYRSLKVGTFSVRCKITGTDFPRHYMDYGLYYHYSGYTFPHIAERKKRDTFAWYDTNNKTVMEEIMQLDNVFQYNELLHCETLHPLVNMHPGRAYPFLSRLLCCIPQGREMRRHTVRTEHVRLPGGNARIHRSGTVRRHHPARGDVSAQRMGLAVPPRLHPGNAARPQHSELHLLFIRCQ